MIFPPGALISKSGKSHPLAAGQENGGFKASPIIILPKLLGAGLYATLIYKQDIGEPAPTKLPNSFHPWTEVTGFSTYPL